MEIIKKTRNNDRIVELEGVNYRAVVNLSALNQRIVIKEYQGSNLSGLKQQLEQIGRKKNLTKIWVKAYKEDKEKFAQLDFKREAEIDAYYSGTDAVIMSYYLTEKRGSRENKLEKEKKLAKVRAAGNKLFNNLPAEYEFKLVPGEDLSQLADLYADVFASYPYPIDSSDYLAKMQQEDVIYGGIYHEDDLVAAASAETVPQYKNAEMTDFATLPAYRGQGLASYLLFELEQVLKNREYTSLYTIARAKVLGINKIFSQAGYHFTGTLVKNCNIAGGLEDMNVWCKKI